MPQRIPVLDFTGGLISEKFSSRYDLPFYLKGCSILNNFLPIPQGGVTFMPGTTYYGTTLSSAEGRLIPFVVGHLSAFIVEITPGNIRIWKEGTLTTPIATFSNPEPPGETVVPYSTVADIKEIHVGQSGSVLYLVHRNHPIKTLTWSGGTSFAFASASITGNTGSVPFQTATNYPSTVAGVAGRMAFGGSITNPNRIWISKPFEPTNFTYHEDVTITYEALLPKAEWADPYVPETEEVSETREVITAGNAFYGDLASEECETILAMVANRDLIISTTGGEWVVPANMTALTAQVILQSRHGGTRVQPIMTGSMAYILTDPSTIKAYQYQDTSAAWNAMDISFQSEILAPGVVDMDYAQHPNPTLYCVLEDGTVAIALINAALQAVTWSLYTPANSGEVESLAVIPGTDGDDLIWMIVKRGSARFIEVLDKPFSEQHLQATVSVSMTAGSATGLTALASMAVSCVVSGVVYSGTVTAGGALTISGGPTGTVDVGLVYTGTIRTMRPPVTRREGLGATSLRRTPWTGISLYRTRALNLGPAGALTPMSWSVADYPNGFTGDTQIEVSSSWDRDGWVTITQTQPLPATVLALFPEVE